MALLYCACWSLHRTQITMTTSAQEHTTNNFLKGWQSTICIAMEIYAIRCNDIEKKSIYKAKSISPNTEPCGTSWLTGMWRRLIIYMKKLESVRYNLKQPNVVHLITIRSLNLCNRMLSLVALSSALMQQFKHSRKSTIGGQEEIICNQYYFCAMMCSESWLKLFKQITSG